MPAITALAIAGAVPIRRALVALGRKVVRGAKRLDRAIKHRRTAQVLARFDNHMLADIGLTRADLRATCAEPLWDDPTILLRARALERRLARHGISFGIAPDVAAAPPLVPKLDAATISQARITFCGCS